MKKVIIVGGGIGGCVSAIKLKHHGYDVTLIEKNSSLGGKINQVKKDGFTFDMGPTIVMMPHMYDEFLPMLEKIQMIIIPRHNLTPSIMCISVKKIKWKSTPI